MGMVLRLLRSVIGVIKYPYTLAVLHNDKFERANGNLSPNAPWLHSAITNSYNRIIDGKVAGPSTSYSMDIVDLRIPNKSGYIKARLTTPKETLKAGAPTRLNFKSGRTFSSTSVPGNTFLTCGFYYGTTNDRLFIMGASFQRGWSTAPDWAFVNISEPNEYRPNDEIAIFWSGRTVTVFYNGRPTTFEMTDEQWTPGYFAGIGLDTNHSFEEVEVGYFGPLELREYGDSFKSPKLDNVWNLGPNKNIATADGVQSDPVSATATNIYFAGGVSKQQMHEDDQIIRGILKPPSGVTAGSTAGAMLMGRCGSAVVDTVPYVMFYVTPAGGAAIYTIVNDARTARFSTSLGTLTLPIEIELQCIGNRYFGLVDGHPVCEWKDSTNIVPIGEGRRGWGWQTSVNRNSSTYTYGPAFDSVSAYGNKNMTLGSPEVFGVSSSIAPLSGANSFTVQGTNFTAATKVFVGGTECVLLSRWSSNELEFVLPPKAAGKYDLKVTSPFGDATLVGAITYVAAIPRGHYDPTPTVLSPASTYIKIPLNPEDPSVTMATVNGIITGIPKGYYRFRALYTLTYWRSDIRHRVVIPAGNLAPQISSEGSVGAVDKATEFSVGDGGTVELQFYRTGSAVQSVDTTFDFELILLSDTRLPAWLSKVNTQLTGTVANVYEKVVEWASPIDYRDGMTVVNDEIIVPGDGQYTVLWQVTSQTANTSNVSRVTDQLGNIIVSKTSPAAQGSQVVTLKKGDSLKLEIMTPNVSAVSRRTITTATLFRITPVI